MPGNRQFTNQSRSWMARLLLAGLVLAALACRPAATAEPSSAPAPQPQPAAWDQTVAAAKREGKLVVLGPVGADARDSFTVGFQQRYPEIRVEFSGASGSQTAARLLTERQAGLYAADIFIGGTQTAITDLIPAGTLAPLQPFLVGPALQDPTRWLGGSLEFADDEREHFLVFLSGVKPPLAYNPNLVSPRELTSYKDLLDPKWRGKLAMLDPRGAGAGLATATFLYATPSLGRDYLERLFAAGITLSKDDHQVQDWVGRGQYPLALALNETSAIELRRKGVPIDMLGAELVQESSYLTSSYGSLGVVSRAPNSNAAKVYLDWLLSQEGQTDISKAAGYPSRRLDVPTDHLNPLVVPKPGVEYRDNYRESMVRMRDDVVAFLNTIIR
jgi:iron(III) transport system substrate-binding protein